MPPCGRPDLPVPEPLRGAESGTFAHRSIVERLPEIARRTIDENDFPADVVVRLEELCAEIPSGPLRPLEDHAAPDTAAWAGYLAPYVGGDWLEPPWFLVETTFYRRILEITGYYHAEAPGRGQDPFAPQKRESLAAAGRVIEGLDRLVEGAKEPQAELEHLFAAALWGNQADLSMWPGGDEMPGAHAGEGERAAHTLVDDAVGAARYLLEGAARAGRADVLLDNAGAELLADLALVYFLLEGGLVQEVVLWPKAQPTFVSDVTAADLTTTLNALAAEGRPGATAVARRLQEHLTTGRLRLREHLFWNSPLAGWEMPAELCAELSSSDLIVSKGDANYRRLLGDRHWPYTTPLAAVVGYLPAPLLALRTLKSELAAGIAPADVERAAAADPEWLTSGRWGVIQFVNHKDGKP